MNDYGQKFGEFFYRSHDGNSMMTTTFYMGVDQVVMEVGSLPLEEIASAAKLMPYEEGLQRIREHEEKIAKGRPVIIKSKGPAQQNQ